MAAVGGCCLCVGPLSAFSDPSWFKQLPHLTLQPMIHSLGFIILACSSTSSKHRFYKPFWQSRIPLILSQIVNMVTSSSFYLFDLIPWPSGKTSQFLMRVTPMQFSFSKTTPCLLQATSLGTFVSMHNFSSAMAHHLLFLRKFFHHYSCGPSSRAMQLGKIFSLLFGEYGFCMIGHFFFSW